MDSIIAAHLPDFETWQSSCLLFDELPCFTVDEKLYTFNKILADIIFNYFDIISIDSYVYWQNKEFKLCYARIYKMIYLKINNEFFISFYSNGNLFQKYTLLNNEKHGKYIEYHSNGNIKEECNYINGKKDGRCVMYYKNGNIYRDSHYQNGEEHGKSITYYENGNIKEERNYINGNYHGKYISYYENGNIKEECNYENDKRHGKYVLYHKNGDIKEECQYRYGLKD